MDKEAWLRLFEHFFSTKFGHSGVGMATVKGIMGRHGGAMEIHSQPGQGTVIRYLFPLPHDAEDVLPAGKEKSMEDELLPGGTILLVDDEEHVLRVGTDMLSKLGFSVFPAMGGAEAIDLYRKRREDIACIILDRTMPDLGGEAVLEAIRREDSSMPIVISSGFSEKGVARRVGGKTISGFLAKPYGMAELREALRKALK
jgi:CheY-like chemotaxis protein